jgi:hypothetical protein
MAKRWLILVLFVAGCSSNAQQLPTVMPTAANAVEASPTAAALPTIGTTATLDFAAMEATSEAISAPIQTALAQQPDLQGVRSVSALAFDDGYMVTVDANIAAADDNEDTMKRLLAIVQAEAEPLINLRVNSWVDNLPQKSWLWEAGAWTSAVLQ